MSENNTGLQNCMLFPHSPQSVFFYGSLFAGSCLRLIRFKLLILTETRSVISHVWRRLVIVSEPGLLQCLHLKPIKSLGFFLGYPWMSIETFLYQYVHMRCTQVPVCVHRLLVEPCWAELNLIWQDACSFLWSIILRSIIRHLEQLVLSHQCKYWRMTH